MEISASAADDAVPVVVRIVPDRDAADAVVLVLASLEIDCVVVPAPQADGLVVVVAPADRARAEAALADQARDVADLASAREEPAPDRGRSMGGVAAAVGMLCFFLVTGPRGGALGQRWFDHGSALARALLHGQPWRAVTSLTLHADWSHVAGNAVATIIFVSAVCRWLGTGLGLCAVLLAGVVGTFVTAGLTVPEHDAVGASTATFGALGVLCGLQIRRRLRSHDPVRGPLARAVPVLGACLGVFAMLGLGEKVDVIAHLAGLGAGLGLGLALAGARTSWPALPRWADAGLVALAVAVIVASWWMALRFPV